MRRGIAFLILAAFIAQTCVPYAHAQQALALPKAGMRLELSPSFTPPLLKGVKVYTDDPFRLDFILDKGDGLAPQEEANRLIKYFLAALTVPEEDLWVNLSPYEKDRIVPEAFGQTEMGRDLLAQDYILKQVTASLLYPEGEVGKEFWARIYAQAQEKFGTIDIPVDTFNKVWIVPQKATVFESKDAAFVVESRFKVMLESDYLAAGKAEMPETIMAKDVLRAVVIPVLEKEINEGKNFAQLRQVYHSLILATWFKDKVRQSIFGQAYVDQKKVAGVDIADKAQKEKIWARYVEAFKQGVFNFVKEEQDIVSGEMIPRKYFSGGAGLQIKAKGVYLVKNGVFQQPKDFSVDSAEIIEFRGEPFDRAQSADNSMRTFTDEERAQIKHTFAFLQRAARAIKDDIDEQGLEGSSELFYQWLRDNGHKTNEQIRREPEKVTEILQIIGVMVGQLHHVSGVVSRWKKEGRGLVTFNKAGQMLVDSSGIGENLFYDLKDKINKVDHVFGIVLDWMSVDLAKDDRDIMIMVREMRSRLRYAYRGYVDMLEDILHPERIKGVKLDIKMDFSRESKGLPEKIYAGFLLPALPVITDAAQVSDDERILRAADLFYDQKGVARAQGLLDRLREQIKISFDGAFPSSFWPLINNARVVVSANAPVFAITLVDGRFRSSPVIVLNGSAVKEMSDVQLLYLLGHELGHLVFDDIHLQAQTLLRSTGDLARNRSLLTEIEKRSDLLGLALAMGVFGTGSLDEVAQVPMLRKKYQADIARLQKQYDLDRPVIFDPHMQDEARAQWLGELVEQEKQSFLDGRDRKALTDGLFSWPLLNVPAGVDVIKGGRDGLSIGEQETARIALVDEDGQPTGDTADNNDAHRNGQWHMVSHIYLIDPQGRLLLQVRSLSKKTSPGKLQVSISGHVDEGEDPYKAAFREGSEEAGIAIDPSRLIAISGDNGIKRAAPLNNEFATVYFYRMTAEETGALQKNYNLHEIEEYWSMDFDKLEELMAKEPDRFAGSIRHLYDNYPDFYQAIKSAAKDKAQHGGIDLAPDNNNLNVKSAGSGVQFNFDPAVILRFQNAAGITPVILDIHPMTMSLPTFLGISDNVPAQEMAIR